MSQLSRDLMSLRIQRTVAPKNRGWVKWLAGIVLLGGAGVGVALAKPAIERAIFKQAVQVTEISSVRPMDSASGVTATGYVLPQSIAKVGSNVVGRIVKVNAVEGQLVRAGEVLFELDRTTQAAAVSAAQSKVAAARARVLAAKANASEARLPWERQKELAKDRAAPQSRADDLGARVTALEEQVKAGEAEVLAAAADVGALRETLDQYTILSPITGVVQTKPPQIGDVVGPTLPLLEIVDPNSLMVEVDVPEARVYLVRQGQACDIVLESVPNKNFSGRVVELAPRLNRAKATATVKVRFEEQPERLAPEMSARVSFLTKELDASQKNAPAKTVVPAAAVADIQGEKFVFVVNDGRVKRVSVRVGTPIGDGLELIEGPAPGTRVVRSPAGLKDGQTIKEEAP